jgi:aspartate kinase
MAAWDINSRTISLVQMRNPLIFKFGGASVKDAESVKNVAKIIGQYDKRPIVVVVSAMGKTTNAFEEVVSAFVADKEGKEEQINTLLAGIQEFHLGIINNLFDEPAEITSQVKEFIESARKNTRQQYADYSEAYDAIVHHGELISTRIIAAYVGLSIDTVWHDTKKLIKTDDHYRRATVQWEDTKQAIQTTIIEDSVHVVQGFIGSTANEKPTTLGREGSDYTGAVFAYCLNASSLTIWKDVPGMLNGDPKIFSNTTKIDSIPFNEAIELAFYGASIIHPKTIQPLKKKNIPLQIKSFIDPSKSGTTIGGMEHPVPQVANFILKKNQFLLEISTKDLAFIAEHHLSAVYHLFAQKGIVVNLMRNTATRAMFCINHDTIIVPEVLTELEKKFELEWTDTVELLTIRHYSADDEARETQGLEILLEQRTPETVQFVFKRS